MTNPDNNPLPQEFKAPGEAAERSRLEAIEKIPIKVNDLRDPGARAFDLEKFLAVIERLRSEGLYKISREFSDSDYGKYMSVVASSESDHWSEAIKAARAIEITLTTPRNRGIEGFEGLTEVEVRILMGGTDGRVFTFSFGKEGKYRRAGWDDVHLQKRLAGPEAGQDFNLVVDPEPTKKLEL